MSGPTDRTHEASDFAASFTAGGLSARLGGPARDAQPVALIMLDGTSIRGTLHRAPGTRTLDFLNRQAEGFLAITDAIVVHDETTEQVAFVAVNKAHVVQVIELLDGS
jgi:hypothetical protein